MKLPMIKENDGWLDIVLKVAAVCGICFAALAYLFTIRPAFTTHKVLMDAENRLYQARRNMMETEKGAGERREALRALEERIAEKRKKLSWLEISLEKKEVQKAFLEEELADLEDRFREVKIDAVRAYLFKLASDAIQASVGQKGDRSGQVGPSFDVRKYVIGVSRDTCRVSEEGSYRFAAAKLLEQFALEKLPETGSSWEDLVAIVHWHPADPPTYVRRTAHGG
jgi:hypothetical protein